MRRVSLITALRYGKFYRDEIKISFLDSKLERISSVNSFKE